MDKDTIARLRAALDATDMLPLSYRPEPHMDDWGTIRAGATTEWGRQDHLCAVHYPYADEAAKSANRKAGTDPYEASARLLVDALNALPALLSIAERAADVEGMAEDLCDGENGPKTYFHANAGTRQMWRINATAVSRYVLGGE